MNPAKALKPKQLNAIKLLATGTPAHRVAERLEITTMTLYRWQKLPEFEEKLHSIAYTGLDELSKKINIAALTAVETLQEILCNMSEPSTIRIKAAIGVLNAMPSVNRTLEKSLQHRLADFDLQKRFSGPVFTHDSSGNLCRPTRASSYQANGGVMPEEVEV